ncbi:MAG TPA: HAMP domain-containing sensor histidine kinase [Gemmatimonadaceae bacterium]
MIPHPAARSASGSERTDESEVLDEVGRLAGSHLREAAARLLAAPPSDLAELGEGVLASHILWIIHTAHGVGAAGDGETHGATLVLRRRIVDVLMTELLGAWSVELPRSRHMLDTLEALEAARAACRPVLEQSFAAELADRGGLGLVVEVAHDMRSPLTSILFLSEILHRGQSGGLNEVQKRQVGIIYSAALGLVGMASDMIEVARGGKHLSSSQPQPFSINELLASIGDLVTPTAEEKGLELRIAPLSSAHRLGYPTALSRVLLNLTTNALKFTHEGGVELSACAVDGNIVEFAVCDSGPGISADAMETLYQPFRREPRRQTGYAFSGTGLGLAICRRLVTALGAELELETQEGSGTRFSFRLDLPPASTL